MSNLLEKAIVLAVEKHQGQTDKQGKPYILHPLRVMFHLKGETAQIVGILHDVVEDTDVTFDDLRGMGFSEPIIEAVDGLTRRDEESYEEFVARIGANHLAKQVKLADLTDNMDIRRLPSPMSEEDFARLQQYLRAWEILSQ
ncbi:hypothetical protein QUF58_03895 [Anaerolineales bacterium HSG24]|nr:hypothetical protein [Anaerolineales bacterium HSG24]